jgi:hypothetical protein
MCSIMSTPRTESTTGQRTLPSIEELAKRLRLLQAEIREVRRAMRLLGSIERANLAQEARRGA